MSHVCACPNPPGGQIVCSDDQLAICGFRDGQFVGGCFAVPAYNSMSWTLQTITGAHAAAHTYDQAIAILKLGFYENPATGEIVRFSLPKDFWQGNSAR